MSIERNFRYAHDMPPMTAAELSAHHASPRFSACGLVALALALAILFVWIEIASGQDRECKYIPQGSTWAPVLLCERGKGG